MKAQFIAFEGGDASGKTTQARRVADNLNAVFTREPGGTTIGESLRAILLDPNEKVALRAEALLMAASRAQLVADVISPALREGRHVVTDRFIASSLTYQGYASGLAVDDVLSLSLFATESLRPDLTLLIDISVEESIKRRGLNPDRFEQEDISFHQKVRNGYLDLAAVENEKWAVIDGTGNPQEVASLVDEAINKRLDLP